MQEEPKADQRRDNRADRQKEQHQRDIALGSGTPYVATQCLRGDG